ncbi:hypothetical protein Bca101_061243 [Brassica carinata]
MIQLKPLLNDFMRCLVNDGTSSSFWFDTWTLMGPLISVLGEGGPPMLRLRKCATVSEASSDGVWHLPPARSPTAETLQIVLTTVPLPSPRKGPDQYLWRKGDGSFGTLFSSRITWEHIRQKAPTVFWSKVVWFKENIPRNAFVTWMAMLRRLPTRDRLRNWGLNVLADCVLCCTGVETHHHLFFECDFSSSIWKHFAQQILAAAPADLHSAAALINQHRLDRTRAPVIKKGFWLTQDSTRLSPTVRSMIQLKPLLNDFMRCLVNDGISSSFWFDTWTLLGPLISVLGEGGPPMLRLRKCAIVSEASSDGVWHLPPARSPAAEILQIVLTTVPLPSPRKGPDQYLWRKGDGSFGTLFSFRITWEHIKAESSYGLLV